jgi:hypothetical protein
MVQIVISSLTLRHTLSNWISLPGSYLSIFFHQIRFLVRGKDVVELFKFHDRATEEFRLRLLFGLISV